jgi:hypothetical protein
MDCYLSIFCKNKLDKKKDKNFTNDLIKITKHFENERNNNK